MINKSNPRFNKWTAGGMEIFLLIVIVVISFFLVGGFGRIQKSTPPPSGTDISSTATCCDSGDGDSCRPSSSDKLTFAGKEYGLLKTSITLSEGTAHLKDSGEKYNGDPIIINTTDTDNASVHAPPCNGEAIFGGNGGMCEPIPNDALIYVCKSDCVSNPSCGGIFNCYGNQKTTYDAYYRMEDYASTGIPNAIKHCSKTVINYAPPAGGTPTIAIVGPQEARENLQLQTFRVKKDSGSTVSWLSPWCKPAIYLYPEKETQVSVQVQPVGKFTYTNPLYPSGGWTVTAKPDGTILSNTKTFPYLYYEADIPSILIEKPQEGFVVSKNDLSAFLSELLPKLGLNSKESTEMSAYWNTSLSEKKYYFIGIIPESTLNSIASLSISPFPQTVIRVSLYFEPLDNPISVPPPVILPRSRNGFTVVEWGGVVKTDKQFTCLQ